ncbi:MFS transporter [Chloroflexota bacterium]
MSVVKGIKPQRFYGWIALSGAMLVSFSMVGNTITSYGVFLPVMSEELNWSRTVLSGPYTTFWIVMGLLGPIVGLSVGKFGSRKNIFWGNLLVVLGLLAMSLVSEIWHVYLFFGVMIGTGQAFGTFIATTTVANNWFIKRRSLAMGLVTASGGVGGLTIPPFISWFISNVSWQMGWICLASIHALLAIFVAGILVRNKPEDMNQVPDGKIQETIEEDITSNTASKQIYQTRIDWIARDALRTPTLWLILIFVAAHLFSLNFITLHQVVYMEDLGFTPIIAATTLGVLAGMSVIGQLVFGALGVKVEGRYLAAFCLILFITGITILMNFNSLPFIYLHTLLSGIGYGGLIVLMPVMIGSYYGRTNYSQIIGWTIPFTTLFSSVSPLIAGFIYDSTGSYNLAFIIAITFLGIGLICALLAKPPKLKHNRKY